MHRFIALYRVSTGKQEDSQLGLKAQEFTVRNYIQNIGGELIEEIVEIESASNKDKINTKNRALTYEAMLAKRTKLKYALQRAEELDAVIIVKEPSRLTRFSILMGYLIEYKVKFICADCPNDDAMMLKLRTVFNEEENLRRSQRTKLALEQIKLTGSKKLGNNGYGAPEWMRQKAVEANKRLAREAKENIQAMDIICRCRKDGMTLKEISEKLNGLHYKTRRGGVFVPTTVSRLLKRC
jgi:DNA invertase Pin-like site-specific DNA recombinase